MPTQKKSLDGEKNRKKHKSVLMRVAKKEKKEVGKYGTISKK
jgi:hypothetical protein